MYQRMPYWNRERGYYYFHPYHVAILNMQQERAAGWGRDPRNPYDNRFLDKIHDDWVLEEEIKEKQRNIEELPQVPGDMEKANPPEELQPDLNPAPDPKPDEKTPPDEQGGTRKPSARKVVKIGFSEP
jgi:hypothetical protein